jgi:hypothetical protein
VQCFLFFSQEKADGNEDQEEGSKEESREKGRQEEVVTAPFGGAQRAGKASSDIRTQEILRAAPIGAALRF